MGQLRQQSSHRDGLERSLRQSSRPRLAFSVRVRARISFIRHLHLVRQSPHAVQEEEELPLVAPFHSPQDSVVPAHGPRVVHPEVLLLQDVRGHPGCIFEDELAHSVRLRVGRLAIQSHCEPFQRWQGVAALAFKAIGVEPRSILTDVLEMLRIHAGLSLGLVTCGFQTVNLRKGILSQLLAFRIAEVIPVGKRITASWAVGVHDSSRALELDQHLRIFPTHVLESLVSSFSQTGLHGAGGPSCRSWIGHSSVSCHEGNLAGAGGADPDTPERGWVPRSPGSKVPTSFVPTAHRRDSKSPQSSLELAVVRQGRFYPALCDTLFLPFARGLDHFR